jgi:hypothetical protein
MTTDRLVSGFQISASMRPYIMRLRLGRINFDRSEREALNAHDAAIIQMRQILAEKRINGLRAENAIYDTLEAAADQQLSRLRSEHLQAKECHSRSALDDLIKWIWELRDAISRLPPRSKGKLNKHVRTVLEQPTFDTETLFPLLARVAQILPGLSPNRRAQEAFSILVPRLPGVNSMAVEETRPPLVDLWETIPPITRVQVERLIQQKKAPTSLVAWLMNFAQLLEGNRSVRKRGAPRTTLRLFVFRAKRIWTRLGLKPGRQYNAHESRHVESAFQRYWNAALAAFGDRSSVSARQVSNINKGSG